MKVLQSRSLSFFVALVMIFTGSPVTYAEKGAAKSGTVTIDVKDTDISRVLDAFSQQTGLSVVVGKEVTGTITVRLLNVSWDRALESILKPYGFGYERTGEVIVVLPLAKIQELNDAQPVSSRVFHLKYLDAGDLAPVIQAQLSARGKVQVLEETGQKGWDFGAFGAAGGGQSSRSGTGSSGSTGMSRRSYQGTSERRSKSKRIVVTDIPSVLDRIQGVVDTIDVPPQQVLIQARFMEVNRDRLKDIGIDVGTGSGGATTSTMSFVDVDKLKSGAAILQLGAKQLGGLASPAAFGAKSTDINKTAPFDTGSVLEFRKLGGSQFDILVHALEEDIHTNTLSSPSIVTLDNQEANILVGTQYPILTSNVTGTTSTTTTTSLDYYQDIGIQLRVVPQIAADDHINMIVHPAVTSFSSTLAAKSPEGTTLAEYPIIITREAETQILMKNGETIMIGGLLKDVKTKGYHKTPILGSIPLIGLAFTRRTDDVEKIDLLIFITAKVMKEEEVATQVPPVFEPDKPGSNTKIKWQKDMEQPAESSESEQSKVEEPAFQSPEKVLQKHAQEPVSKEVLKALVATPEHNRGYLVKAEAAE